MKNVSYLKFQIKPDKDNDIRFLTNDFYLHEKLLYILNNDHKLNAMGLKVKPINDTFLVDFVVIGDVNLDKKELEYVISQAIGETLENTMDNENVSLVCNKEYSFSDELFNQYFLNNDIIEETVSQEYLIKQTGKEDIDFEINYQLDTEEYEETLTK